MNIFISFLFCFVSVSYVCTQQISENEVIDYINEVMEDVFQQLLQYGISNLPDEDVNVTYSSPAEGHYYGYKLDGNLHLEDGFAFALDRIEGYSKQASAKIFPHSVSIINEMYLINLKILRDFRFVPEEGIHLPDLLNGALIMHPKILSFYYNITQNLGTMKISTDLNSSHQQLDKERLLFNPQNELTKRLHKAWKPAWDSQTTEGLRNKWQPIFKKFLDKAVQRVEFPLLKFPVSRQA